MMYPRLPYALSRRAGALSLSAFLVAACGGSEPSSPTSSGATAGSGGETGQGGAGGGPGGGGQGAGGAGQGAGGAGQGAGQGEGGAGGEPAALKCNPTGGGPYWILETEKVTFQVSCATDMALDGSGFVVGSLPAGATYDAGTRTVTFQPGLDQAAVYWITVDTPSTGETTIVKVGVADKWNDPSNVPVVEPSKYTEEYGLPVLFLSPAPTTEEYAPATVVYGGHSYEGAEAKLRGAASLYYPKNSFTLSFTKGDKFQEPNEAGGFVDKRKLVLISTFDDNSYVRQRLAYDLWNRLDPGHIQIQTYSAVVFVDGQYFGLYTVSDHVDGNLMKAHGYDEDGNLYKAVDHDANFTLYSPQNGGAPKQTLHQGYVKREGTPLEGEAGAFADLEALVTFVATSSSPTFLSQIDGWIDRRDYEDWFIFVTFVMGDDSAGKNSYHYHDPTQAGSVFRYAPWDFNASLGQTWQTAREGASYTVEYAWANKIFERFLTEPTIGGPLRARYAEVLHDQYSLPGVQALVDGYVARIDASARRDEVKWMNSYRTYGGWSWRNDFTTYEQEIPYLKAWIDQRWQYQDNLY